MIATLSGGNQQKVVVARWMEAGSRLLVLEEPTFGVDVGSKAEIYRLLQEALDQGLAVLLISSDFEEVAGICHRALDLGSRPGRGRDSAQRALDGAADGAGLGRRRGDGAARRGMSTSSNVPAPMSPWGERSRFLSVWNLAILLVLLIVVFSLLKGDTFLTAFTFQSMVNSRSINAMVALAVMIPLASNNFDLSVASILGISQVLANGLHHAAGPAMAAAMVLCILLGAAVGLLMACSSRARRSIPSSRRSAPARCCSA